MAKALLITAAVTTTALFPLYLICLLRTSHRKIGNLQQLIIFITTYLLSSDLRTLLLLIFSTFSLTNYTVFGLGEAVILLSNSKFRLFLFKLRKKLPFILKMAIDKEKFLFGLIVFFQLLFYFKPYEWIYGGRDPASYINQGIYFSQHGSLSIKDPLIPEFINSENYKYFYRFNNDSSDVSPYSQVYGLHAHTFYITDITTGTIKARFFYLYPALIALFNTIGGIRLSLYSTPILMLSSVWILYILARKITSREVAFTSLLLFSFNFATVWYARYPNSEVLLLVSLLFSLYLFHLNLINQFKNKFLSLLTGIFLATGLLIKIDYIPIHILLFLVFMFLFVNNRSVRQNPPTGLLLALLGFLLTSAIAIATGLHYAEPYITNVIDVTFGILNVVRLLSLFNQYLMPLLFLLLGLLLITVGLRKKIVKFAAVLKTKNVSITYLLCTINVLIVLFFLLRASSLNFETNSTNMLKLSLYLSPWVVILGFVGLPLLRSSHKMNSLLLWIIILLAEFHFLFYMFDVRFAPDHPWWARRFVPVVIPFLIISFSNLLVCVAKYVHDRKTQLLGRSLIHLTFISYIITISPGLLTYIEYKGAIDYMDELTGRFDDALILVTDHEVLRNRLRTPLYYIYAKDVIPLANCQDNGLCQTAQIETVEKLRSQYQRILLFTDDERYVRQFEQKYRVIPVVQESVELRLWPPKTTGLSLMPFSKPDIFNYTIYELR